MNPLGTGAHVSPVDPRDWTPASVGALTSVPDSAFIEEALQLYITMQGKIGSCVGNTFEEIMRLITILMGGTQEPLSWRFVYAMCKSLEGTSGYEQFTPTQEGTYPALAAKVIRKFGVPLEKYCPNDIELSHEDFVYGRKLYNIPQKAKEDAATRTSGADIAFPPTEAGIKQAIVYAKENKGGVAILRRIGDTYWMADGMSTYDKVKLLPIKATANIVSGHEELLYGYDIDPANGRTRIYWQNHWSKKWCSTGGNGDDGGRAWEYLDSWLPYIVELRVVVAAIPTIDTFRYTFTKNLQTGMKGADVVALQHILKIEGCFDYPKFTGFYGGVTATGVRKLQEKYADEILKPLGLTQGTGNFANATRAWVNKKYGA